MSNRLSSGCTEGTGSPEATSYNTNNLKQYTEIFNPDGSANHNIDANINSLTGRWVRRYPIGED